MPENRRQTDVRNVDLEQAKAEFDKGKALFVDLRSPEAYEDSHIPGALSMPLREILRRIDELPRDRPIIFY